MAQVAGLHPKLSTAPKPPLALGVGGVFDERMPKSRGRRGRKPSRSPSGGNRLKDARARAIAEFPFLQATDAAELRGDAWGALRIIEDHVRFRRDQNFWRPWRIERLVQLAGLGSMLPRWATSRWILAQAAQWLDEWGRAPGSKAMEIAVAARGGEAALVGTDAVDAKVKVVDHDWLFRQVYLYELGALQHFVGRVATPDLLAGADRLHDWARAPMGAFRFLHESPLTLTWLDLTTGQEVESLNLGSASLLDFDECAIGRLVPVEEGAMFESAPLLVPERVARQVADEPADWVATVSAACRETGPGEAPILTGHGHDFRLLTDLPSCVQRFVAVSAFEGVTGRRAPVESATDLLSVEVGLLRAALEGRLAGVEAPISIWPSVAATLLNPRVMLRVKEDLAASDAPKLERLAGLLGGPAAGVCLSLARDLETAA